MLKDKKGKIIAAIVIIGTIVGVIARFTSLIQTSASLVHSFVRPKVEIHLAQFTIDEDRSLYRAYHLGSDEEANRWLSFIEWNFLLMPSEVRELAVAVVFDQRTSLIVSELANPAEGYPFFLVTLQNDGSEQAVINKVSVRVYDVKYLHGFGETKRLDPLATYVVKISTKEGVFHQQLVPPVKIAADDSATLGIRLLPEHMGEYPHAWLIADLTIHWRGGKVTTPQFLLLFES